MAVIILPIHGGAPTATPLGLAWSASGRPSLTADGTTDETRVWSFRLPDDYSSGLSITVSYSMASATTGNVAIRIETMAASDNEGITADSFDTLEASSDSAVPGTAGNRKTITKSLANIDGAAAGDTVAFIIGRENATSGTNATGDMYIWDISVTYTAA